MSSTTRFGGLVRSALRLSRLPAGALAILAALLGGCGGSAPTPIPATMGSDPGAPISVLHQPAPDFTLTDQFGQTVSLHDYRGKVVILAFTDSECTTICPLTTQSMVQALTLLGPAASDVQLLGIDANPQAISVADVMSYSTAHGLNDDWHFLTGSLTQLRKVWSAYHVFVAVEQGSVDHTPALFVIDPSGTERYLYLTPMEYAAIPQEAQVLADAASQLMPSHPRVLPVTVPGHLSPGPVTLPVVAGTSTSASVRLGAGAAQLVVYWASWLPDAASQLAALNRYALDAQSRGLPSLVAVDEAPTEPSAHSASDVLSQAGALLYPAAVDSTGRVADLYGVSDLAWLVLIDAHAHVLWSHDGWLAVPQLEAAVTKALGRH
jgi:cytochrome oxidase Cu insertion factor (SCO1/SenC/PrrC family)